MGSSDFGILLMSWWKVKGVDGNSKSFLPELWSTFCFPVILNKMFIFHGGCAI